MAQRRHGFLFAGIFVLVLGALTLVAASLAQGPDREVRLKRRAVSALPAETLDRALFAVINWSTWFKGASEIQAVDGAGRPFPAAEQTIATGVFVRVKMGKSAGATTLLTQVVTYVPRERLVLRLLEDSSGRLTSSFQKLEWELSLTPSEAGGSLIEGEVHAWTAHWKARVFAVLLERLVLGRLFFPDLEAWGALKNPRLPNPLPAEQQ